MIIKRLVGLSNNQTVLFISSQISYIISNPLVFLIHTAIRSLHKAKAVDSCIVGQGTNQTDVRTFWGFNRTHATIMGVMYISNLEACTLTRQTARTKGRQTTLMSQLSQWVVLIHELRQLGGTKKFLDSCHNRTNIDQGRRIGYILLHGHALLDYPLHTGKTNAELVLQQLAYRANTTVAQMVNIISLAYTMHQIQQIADGSKNIVNSNGALAIFQSWGTNHLKRATLIVSLNMKNNGIALTKDCLLLLSGNIFQHICINQGISWNQNLTSFFIQQRLCQYLALNTALPAQLLGQLVTAYSCQIITLSIKEQAAEHLMSIVYVERLTRTNTAINLLQSVSTSSSIITLQSGSNSIIIIEECQNLLIAAKYQIGSTNIEMVIIAALHSWYSTIRSGQLSQTQLLLLIDIVQSTEEYSYRQLTGTVDTNGNYIISIGFQFNPSTTVWNYSGVEEGLTRLIYSNAIISAWRTYQLADNNTLCTINNKGTGSSHQREIPHEYLRILEDTSSSVQKANLDTQWSCIGSISFLAFIKAILRLSQLIVQQGEAYLALKI